jgi:hypothetical protein
VADPAAGAVAVIARNETLDVAIETERLVMANEMNIVTPYVTENGFGDVDMERLAASIETLKISMDPRRQRHRRGRVRPQLPAARRRADAALIPAFPAGGCP